MRKLSAQIRLVLKVTLPVVVLASALNSPVFAEVYKHVDEKGNVSYSDVPQKKGDAPISLPEPTTYKSDRAPKSSTGEGRKKPAPKIVQYDSVVIAAPENGATIRSNTGDIAVQISSTPALQSSNVYVVFLDGNKIQESPAASVTLTNVDRGSHTISVQIHDDKAQVLANSEPVTIHLFRQSVIKHK